MQQGRGFSAQGPRPRGLPPASQQFGPGQAPPPRPSEDGQRQFQLRRIAHVPTDRAIPDGVDSMVLGDVVQRYNSLRDVERKLDATLISKRFAARDTVARYERRLRTMRVWISCSSSEQDSGDTRMDDTFEFGDDAGGGSYKLRIEGRLLPSGDGADDEDDDQEEVKLGEGTTMDLDKPESREGTSAKRLKEAQSFERQKFSHYFHSITISFNPPPHALPNATTPPAIQWKKPAPDREGQHPTSADANFDALELERKLEEGVQNITISMERADPHGRVRGKLSPALARVLDREYEDQSGAMMGIYNYVRLNNLEQEGQPQYFRCDEALKAVFGTDTANFMYMPEKIMENIRPLPDIQLPFTIKLNSPPSPPTIYDVPVLVDDPMDVLSSNFRSSTNPRDPDFIKRLETISQLDKDIALAVQGMYASKAKIDFLNQLSVEPVGFIKKWVSSQQADEEIILAEEKSRGPEWNRGGDNGLWASTGARESVGLLLARQKPT